MLYVNRRHTFPDLALPTVDGAGAIPIGARLIWVPMC